MWNGPNVGKRSGIRKDFGCRIGEGGNEGRSNGKEKCSLAGDLRLLEVIGGW